MNTLSLRSLGGVNYYDNGDDAGADGEHSDVRQFLRVVRCAQDRSVPDRRPLRRTQHVSSHQLRTAARHRGTTKQEQSM